MLLDTVELPPLMSSDGHNLSLLVSPFLTQDKLKVVGDSVGQTLPLVDGF